MLTSCPCLCCKDRQWSRRTAWQEQALDAHLVAMLGDAGSQKLSKRSESDDANLQACAGLELGGCTRLEIERLSRIQSPHTQACRLGTVQHAAVMYTTGITSLGVCRSKLPAERMNS